MDSNQTVREVLEGARKKIDPFGFKHDCARRAMCRCERCERFESFLHAEAYLDAAMMLLDRDKWRILSIHEAEHPDETTPAIEVRLGQRDAGFGRGRIIYGTGADLPEALATAALKAQDHQP